MERENIFTPYFNYEVSIKYANQKTATYQEYGPRAAIHKAYTLLKSMGLENYLDKGEFVTTYRVVDRSPVIKRYVINVDILPVEIMIRKMDTGPINTSKFLRNIKKRGY